MKKQFRYGIATIMTVALLFTGCSSGNSSQANANDVDTAMTTQDAKKGNESDTDSISQASISTSVDTLATSQVVVDQEFSARDLEVGYEDSSATQITGTGTSMEVSGTGATYKDGVLTISAEGTYVISGSLADGQIVVDADEKDKVQIVLNGASITCSDNAPIYIKSADKVFLTLVNNTSNTLIDGTEYVQTDENSVDGVIFSKADLTINGSGTLNITGNYKHGIATKDDLVITGGIFNITAVKDAINGKDSVKIKDGTFNLSASTGNGIQSKNGDNTTKGYVYICGGKINVTKCREGIEGTAIVIEDGVIIITAEDDGLNAASGTSDTTDTTTDTTKDTTVDKTADTTADKATDRMGGGENPFEVDTNCYILISGGTITIDALGDGIDCNGSISISGGTIYVSGPTNSGNGGLDYNGTANITGGTIIVAGSTGMAQGFSETSSQYSLLYNLTTVCKASTEVKLTDKDGKVVTSYTPNKEYQSVVISTPELAKDETYTLTCGDQTAEITLSTVVTSNGQQGMGGQGGFGGQGGQDGQTPPERPNEQGTTGNQDGTSGSEDGTTL